MMNIERFKAHKGGLIQLKTALYWYGSYRQTSPGEVCLLLDAGGMERTVATAAYAAPAAYPTSILILIEEKPQWILVVEADVEMIGEK